MTKVFVIDTETTGLEETDRVVELAVLVAQLESTMSVEGTTHSSLTPMFKAKAVVRPDPWVNVKPEARANHHLTDEEIRAGDRLQEVIGRFPQPSADDVVVAHNLDFDERMLRQSGGEPLIGKRRVCTYRCARHIWPERVGYSNQVLRYALDIRVAIPPEDGHAHRAMYDAMVTYGIFAYMLTLRTVRELEDYTSKVPLQTTCKLPKYKGTPWEKVPSTYMFWILKAADPFHEEIQATCKFWLRMRGEIK